MFGREGEGKGSKGVFQMDSEKLKGGLNRKIDDEL